MQRALGLLSLALTFLAAPGHAQRATWVFSIQQHPQSAVPATGPAAQPSLPPRHSPSPVLLGLGGLGAATLGTFTGAVIGAKLTTRYPCEDCGLEGLVYGGVAGGSALLPLGVHLANGRRGTYGASLLASLGIGAAGLAVAVASDQGAVMLTVPVLQLVSSIAIERATAR
jgi:hypothetical protein